MEKLVLLSALIGLVWLPIVASRDDNVGRGVKRAVWLILALNVFYVLALRFIYPRFL